MKGGKMDKKQMWIVVGIAVVVALAVSVVAAGITGGVIKVYDYNTRTYSDAYTKQEIDSKINSIGSQLQTKTTNQGILNMFRDNCILTNPDLYRLSGQYKIYWVCEKYNTQYNKSTTCVLADQFNYGKTQVLNCDSVLTAGTNSSSGLVHVMCCSP